MQLESGKLKRSVRQARYFADGFQDVEGWCHDASFTFVNMLHEIQYQESISGSICEIGLYRGKFFIGLCLLLRGNEIALGIDLFVDHDEEQEISFGPDNETIVRNNLKLHVGDHDDIKILKYNSMDLDSETLLDHLEGQKARMFSIDGSHQYDAVLSDLYLSQNAVVPGGIVIVDDILNRNCPGVREAVEAYYDRNENVALYPFAQIANKLYLTTRDYQEKYIAYVSKSNVFTRRELINVWGHEHYFLEIKE